MNTRVGACRLIYVVAAALLSAYVPRAAHSADKLNVVLIAVDDLNNNLSCYGHPLVRSPNIDRLANRGVRFDRAYCQYPVCNPSRVSLLAGRRPDTTRIYDLKTPPRTFLKDVVFLPQYFRGLGYFTAHVGKIFHTGPEFEDPPSWDLEIRETGKSPPDSAKLSENKFERPQSYGLTLSELKWEDSQTADGVVARQAAGMLAERVKDGKPFFFGIGFRRPHSPYAAPRKYFEMYPADKIPPLDEPPDHLRAIPPLAFTYPVGTPNLPESQRRQAVAAYYACISFVDAQIGVVLRALDELDLWKNTVVVLYGDHGYHLGEHGGMFHKMSLFEESARVPLIVAAPKADGNGKACPRVVELLDIYPTVVDLCGLPQPDGLEGKSLRPLLSDPQTAWSEAAFTQALRGEVMGRSVRSERWRYTEWDEGRQGKQLYNHDADPREFVNLADRQDLQPVVEQLQRLVRTRASAPAN
jgi:iduronate 2-sulfatase